MIMKTNIFHSLFLLIISFSSSAQYSIPVSQGQFQEPIINGVTLGDINNVENGNPLLEIGYSDYTSMSADLDVGETYTLTIISGAAFQYNYSAWIDFNRNDEFEVGEKIGSTITANGYPTVNIEFTVPTSAHSGATRLRVRATVEPYGIWVHPTDPEAPWQGGETEDYSVNIMGGKNNDVSIRKIFGPVSGVGLADESVTLKIQNNGITPAGVFTVNCSVNNGSTLSENFTGSLDPDSSVHFTFSSSFSLNDIGCYEIKAWLTWDADEDLPNDTAYASVCHTEPVSGTTVWYVQSNVNGGLEPLGGPPYNSTTNRTCMNDVFGESQWLEGSFEETDPDSIFSTASCLVFIDGSYEGEVALQNYVNANRTMMENWVASGGHLFLLNANDGSLSNDSIIFNLGFGDIKTIASFVISYGIPYDTLHPIFNEPYTPARKQWSAFYYAPSILFGQGFDTLIADNDDAHFLWNTLNLPLLIEKEWGEGRVIMGTISPSQLVSPSNPAMNNRRNTLVYLHDCVATSTGLQPGDDGASLSLFPNPASGEVRVHVSDALQETRIAVYDLSGVEVTRAIIMHPDKGDFILDVSTLHAGVYLVEVKDEGLRMMGKLAVAH